MTEKIWVAIETHKGTHQISSYRGQMLQSDMQAWVDGSYSKRCIKLESVHWLEGIRTDTDEAVYTQYGVSQGYETFSGEVYLLAEQIVALIPMILAPI